MHVPVVGAKKADTANTCKLIHNRYVKHYWDPSGDTGRVFSTGLGLKDRKGAAVYAWDVWLVYGADVPIGSGVGDQKWPSSSSRR